ncbi:hypothetical protein K6U06_02585 [Acidiferrimicrobium sp. IK]|uniref:hypothetical protein n=1 Tax=Acidiferrimicrobium sp. IK TaxID=2871700 RepID=UPI0021CB7F5E|nr:hypothetical protein [Acidiferrimicrobium sp. IK]MCU4183232.1 hypothetical protein [Acidiferrimicrobium sp. IK]
MQKWVTRRAFLWHALLIIIVPGCLIAGWWQLDRAMSGNGLSWAYTFEWPIFAVLAVVGWWQLIHEAPEEVQARKEERLRRAKQIGPPTADPIPAPTRLMLTTTTGPGLLPGPGSEGATEIEESKIEAAAAALDRYNDYLASLKDKGKAKTWRNPQGLP